MQNRLSIESLKNYSIEISNKIKLCYDPANKDYVDSKEYTANKKIELRTFAQAINPYAVESTTHLRSSLQKFYFDDATHSFVTHSFFKTKKDVKIISYTTACSKFRESLGRSVKRKKESFDEYKIDGEFLRKTLQPYSINIDGKTKYCTDLRTDDFVSSEQYKDNPNIKLISFTECNRRINQKPNGACDIPKIDIKRCERLTQNGKTQICVNKKTYELANPDEYKGQEHKIKWVHKSNWYKQQIKIKANSGDLNPNETISSDKILAEAAENLRVKKVKNAEVNVIHNGDRLKIVGDDYKGPTERMTRSQVYTANAKLKKGQTNISFVENLSEIKKRKRPDLDLTQAPRAKKVKLGSDDSTDLTEKETDSIKNSIKEVKSIYNNATFKLLFNQSTTGKHNHDPEHSSTHNSFSSSSEKESISNNPILSNNKRHNLR